jgi:catalase
MGSDHTSDPKQRNLEPSRVRRDTGYLTTQQGVRVDHTDDSLTAGERGPTLLEDFHSREKITHFDHERIPERVVHARGAGAYGFFEPYDEWLAEYTAAEIFDHARHADSGVRPLLHGGWVTRVGRHRARRARLCHQVLYRTR